MLLTSIRWKDCCGIWSLAVRWDHFPNSYQTNPYGRKHKFLICEPHLSRLNSPQGFQMWNLLLAFPELFWMSVWKKLQNLTHFLQADTHTHTHNFIPPLNIMVSWLSTNWFDFTHITGSIWLLWRLWELLLKIRSNKMPVYRDYGSTSWQRQI